MTTDEEDYLWHKDTDEYGGMYVIADGTHVMVVVSPAFEYLRPDDADAMADALRCGAALIRARGTNA